RSRHGPDPAVQAELADRRVTCQPFRRQLPRRREHREGDGKVETRALLAKRRGGEVDRDSPVQRPLERRRDDSAADAMLRFLTRAVDEAHDREARDPRLEVRLDLDPARLEPDESVSERTRQHTVTLGTEALPKSDASVPNA